MILYIKNMVSLRCKLLVKSELDKLSIPYLSVELGEVQLKQKPNPEQYENFKNALVEVGLELIEDRKFILVERIKKVIIEMVHNDDELPKQNFSHFLAEKLQHDYTYLANIFSESTGMTIELYTISLKIERAKELLMYDEMNLTEISYKLNYSSVAHLSNQFKKITGFTPTFFKQLKSKLRDSIDDVSDVGIV